MNSITVAFPSMFESGTIINNGATPSDIIQGTKRSLSARWVQAVLCQGLSILIMRCQDDSEVGTFSIGAKLPQRP